ncbi:MAG: hypothetical protein LUC90_07850 [Lachnospiraceae bacterium]|nr:hypothetical protein [Clostridiales bacterium]MCD8326582.1 hypothetical protein [Lachnospiraceae bacterium]
MTDNSKKEVELTATKITYYRYGSNGELEASTSIEVGDLLEDGHRVTQQEITFLQEDYHRQQLGDRYYREHKDGYTENAKTRYETATGKEVDDPINQLPSEGSDPLDILLDTEEDMDSPDEPEDIFPSPEALKEALDNLPEEDRRLIMDIYYEDKAIRAVARESGRPESTLRYHHKRILKKLKKLLSE